jgi:formiminotetrahydrofolate cyclodeaminase
MHTASDIPVQTAEGAREVLDLAAKSAAILNVNVLGDVAVAAHVALGAVRSAADQAELNLQTIADTAFAALLRRRLEHALDAGDNVVARTVETIHKRVAA